MNDIVANNFDEIILYNVSAILAHGDELASDHSDNDPIFDNTMLENETMEWHLARFIYKAKDQHNLKVVASVPDDISNSSYQDRFYQFYVDYARTSIPDNYAEIADQIENYFINKYGPIWASTPERLPYLDYGEDTLFFPVVDGRISWVDKTLTDIYNLNLFEYRVRTGLVGENNWGIPEDEQPLEAINPIGTGDNKCKNAFDGHLFEWEWWVRPKDQYGNTMSWSQYQVDSNLLGLLELIHFSKALQTLAEPCYPQHYVVQDYFSNTSFQNTFFTEQQRANKIDSIADRVYLYSYHKNPCDCYWGQGNNTTIGDPKDFNYKVNLLANNNYGSGNNGGGTFVLPVFMAKYYDSVLINSPDVPQEYGDGNRGCNNDLDNCDYCSAKSGTALNFLYDNGYPKELGYVENSFQYQYDFDGANTSPQNSDNIIFGYTWFKTRLLQDNSFVSGINDSELGESYYTWRVYPNPTSNNFTLESEEQLDWIKIYDLTGKLVYTNNAPQFSNEIPLDQAGVYIVQVANQDRYGIQKIVRW